MSSVLVCVALTSTIEAQETQSKKGAVSEWGKRSSTNDGCTTKEEFSGWPSSNMIMCRQKYTLSCEIALIRLSLGIAGIRDISEDAILATIPKGTDPESAFVCEDISSGRLNKDGSIRWSNYGTHAPVVAKSINDYLSKRGKENLWEARELRADDERLRSLVQDPSFRGAVI